MFDIVRVDQHQPIDQAPLVSWRQLGQVGDGAQHVALAVDDDQRALAIRERIEVAQDELLQELRLTVTRAADDVVCSKRVCKGTENGSGVVRKSAKGVPRK